MTYGLAWSFLPAAPWNLLLEEHWRLLPELAWRLPFLTFFSACDGLTNGLARTRDKLAVDGGAFEHLLFEAAAACFCIRPMLDFSA